MYKDAIFYGRVHKDFTFSLQFNDMKKLVTQGYSLVHNYCIKVNMIQLNNFQNFGMGRKQNSEIYLSVFEIMII